MPLVVPLLVAGISLGRPSPASAATVCNNPDTFAFQNTTIKDSLVVPAGGSCNVTNVVIRGDLTVTDGDTIRLFVERTTVRGSATISDNAFIVGNSIKVNLICEGNTDAGGALEVSGNVVGGVATGQCA